MASSPVAVDGYIQSLPPHSLTLTELHREVTRCSRARETCALGPVRESLIERMWMTHQERATRISLLTLRAGYSLI